MAHQQDAGNRVSVLLLARKDIQGNDLLETYDQMELKEIVLIKRESLLCGLIIDPKSGWRDETVRAETTLYDPSGTARVVSTVDHANQRYHARIVNRPN